MQAFVTGATGFIGPHLCRALNQAGYHVKCLARAGSATARLAGLDMELVRGDIADPSGLRTAVQGPQLVVHLAGLTKALTFAELLRVNEQGTSNLAAACQTQETPPTLIVVSSMAASGPAPEDRPRVETDPATPVSGYGRSKRAGELAAARFAGQVPISIVRPPIVFGEGDRDMLSMYRPINWMRLQPAPGLTTRRMSMIHAADLSAGLVAIAERGARLQPADAENDPQARGWYLLADRRHPTYAEWGQLIAGSLGVRCFTIPTPEFMLWAAAGLNDAWSHVRRRRGIFSLDKVREATSGSWTCSAERSREEVGFEVSATLEDRFAQTTEWYRREGWI